MDHGYIRPSSVYRVVDKTLRHDNLLRRHELFTGFKPVCEVTRRVL